MLYGNVAEWLTGWLDVTRRYCIKTAKPILKLFRPSGSPIIAVSSDPCTDTQFQGETLQRGLLYTWGWEKLTVFDGNCYYRHQYAIYRMVPLSMTLSGLWPRFQGHDILKSNIGRTSRLKDTVTISR